jgi:hypothetical protein
MALAWLFTFAIMACIVIASMNRKPPNFLEAASSPNLPGLSAVSDILSIQNVEPYSENIWDSVKPYERDAVVKLMGDTQYLRAIRRQIVRALNDGNSYAAMALVRRTYHVKQRIAQIAVDLIAQRNGMYIPAQAKPPANTPKSYPLPNY